MTKPIYRHPDFVLKTEDKKTENKRFWLKITFDEDKKDNIID